MYKIIRPIFFSMEPEKAHYMAMKLFSGVQRIGFSNLIKQMFQSADDPVEICGIVFKNRVGLAAGFDKDAQWVDGLSLLGFGHIEVGTVTPLSQPGNPRPRLFRLQEDGALINRMGFNNKGVIAMNENLKQVRRKNQVRIGGNIGKNKITPNEEAHMDYIKCLSTLYQQVDYFTINISSPNTPGLRDLQEKKSLMKLLSPVMEQRNKLSIQYQQQKPIFVKIAPDITATQLEDMGEVFSDLNIDGIVATNTTIQRSGLKSSTLLQSETGGLSGKPLESRSIQIISTLKKILPNTPLIGAGGVFERDDYLRKLDAGADLVQVYTGFIYEGPGIVKKLLKS